MSWRPVSLPKYLISVVLSFALIALSPGFAAYEAAAATMTSAAGVQGQTGVAPITNLNTLSIGTSLGSSLTPAQNLRLSGSLSAGIAPAVKVGVAAAPASPVSQIPSLATPLQSLKATPLGPSSLKAQAVLHSPEGTPVAQKLTGMSQQVADTLKEAGSISKSGAETASGVGSRIEAIMTGAPAASYDDGGFAGAAQMMGDLETGMQLARPAGQEISQAAQAYYSQNETKVARGLPEMKDQNPLPKKQSPFWPKVVASGMALLPGIFLGIPALGVAPLLGTVAAVLWGGSLILSSLTLAALPFMGPNTPKAVRVLPGAALVVTGLVGIFTGAPVIGALAALGGWGLIRYGKSPLEDNDYDSGKSLTAFFGGLAAVAGVGLALLSPPGWFAAGLTYLAYPISALLLMHLPSWVGYGMTAAFRSVFESVAGIERVESSMRRDTNVYDRLKAYTKAQMRQSMWNAVWLAGIWVPVWLSQLVQWALSLAVGTAVGAMQSPVMFLWGASHELKADSKPTKFFSAWARFMFDNVQNAKKTLFNRVQAPLLPYVNSQNKFVSLPAALGLRLLQWLWLGYALAATPVLGVMGLFRAFGKTAEAYEPAEHDPAKLRVSHDDEAGAPTDPDQPEEPGQPGKSNLMPRIIATGLALLPAYFFGLPLLTAAGPVIGGAYLAVTLSLAALPFVPANAPKLVRQVPGFLLAGLGLGMLYFLPIAPFGLTAALALLKTNALWTAALAIVGGWGLTRYLGKTVDEEGKTVYSVDDPEYIGAFFAAAAAASAAGVLLAGLAGWLPIGISALAYLTSPLLLMHLPRWVFSGFGSVFEGMWKSFKDSSRFVNLWERETDFYRNLKHHADHWLDKSVWNGSWLSVIWVPMGVMMLADLAVSVALGLAWGLARAPFRYAEGALDRAFPGSAAARFFATLNGTWADLVEGKSARDYFVNRRAAVFIKGASEKTGVSGRPTVAAAFHFLMLRLGQLFFLAVQLGLGTAVMFLVGLGRAVVEAFQGQPQAPETAPKP
jgi:hypothetical protein